jgi:hypothetical protein
MITDYDHNGPLRDWEWSLKTTYIIYMYYYCFIDHCPIVEGIYYNVTLLLFSDVTCFQGFFNFSDIQPILKHFCVYHVNAPGQEEGSLHLKPE